MGLSRDAFKPGGEEQFTQEQILQFLEALANKEKSISGKFSKLWYDLNDIAAGLERNCHHTTVYTEGGFHKIYICAGDFWHEDRPCVRLKVTTGPDSHFIISWSKPGWPCVIAGAEECPDGLLRNIFVDLIKYS